MKNKKDYEMTEELKEKIEHAMYEGLESCVEHLMRTKTFTATELEEMSEDRIWEEGRNLLAWEKYNIL